MRSGSFNICPQIHCIQILVSLCVQLCTCVCKCTRECSCLNRCPGQKILSVIPQKLPTIFSLFIFKYKALISLLWHNAILCTVTHFNVKTFYVQLQRNSCTDSLAIKQIVIQSPQLFDKLESIFLQKIVKIITFPI